MNTQAIPSLLVQSGRRQLLRSSALGALAAVALGACRSAPTDSTALLSAASKQADGRLALSIFDLNGGVRGLVHIPVRAHGITIDPTRVARAVVVGRRPATTAWVLDAETGQVEARFSARVGRHFFGHAVFSLDGKLLYVTENDFANKRGVIAVRDTANWRLLAEFDSHGVGPHEIKFMPDGKTLVVANGGILTHPDQPRKKLNLDTMQPNLAYIDAETGALSQLVTPAHHQLSIRHIDVSKNGVVAVAMQHQGLPVISGKPHALLATHQGQDQQPLRAMTASDDAWRAMRHYVGSVKISGDGNLVVSTTPRGGTVSFWDADKNQIQHQVKMPDVCGLVIDSSNGAVTVTAGTGAVRQYQRVDHDWVKQQEIMVTGCRWDNHLELHSSQASVSQQRPSQT